VRLIDGDKLFFRRPGRSRCGLWTEDERFCGRGGIDMGQKNTASNTKSEYDTVWERYLES
jgi:hypothetical protein